MSAIPHGFCHCGCGERTSIVQKDLPRLGYCKGDPRRFLKGHSSRKYSPAPSGWKYCSKCEQTLPIGDFYCNPLTRDGLMGHCKGCVRARSRAAMREPGYKERQLRFRDTPGRREAARQRARAWWARLTEEERRRTLDSMAAKRKERDPEDLRAMARRAKMKRRARFVEAFVEMVDPIDVLIRDDGICGICGEGVDLDYHLDHIVPLSKGGKHEMANIQLAHPLCNKRKAARAA